MLGLLESSPTIGGEIQQTSMARSALLLGGMSGRPASTNVACHIQLERSQGTGRQDVHTYLSNLTVHRSTAAHSTLQDDGR